MAGYLPIEGSGGTGSGVSVPSGQIFNNNSARNSFFNNNPSLLVEGAECIVLSAPPEGLYQVYTNGDWEDRTAIVIGPQGDKGDTGLSGQIQSVEIVGDNFVFTDNNGNVATLANAVIELRGEQGPQGDTGEAALIVTAEFVGDAIVFTDNDNNTTTLADAVNTLRGEPGPQGDEGPQGSPFIIQKQYDSVAAMEADFAGADVGANEMVMVASGAGVADNGNVYTKGDTLWNYVTTLDGAAAIQGVPGNDGLDGLPGDDGLDGVSTENATIDDSGNLVISLDSGVDIDAGRVTGLSAYEVWVDEGNFGTEEDFIAYLRERITFDSLNIESIGLDDDSGVLGRVFNGELLLSSQLIGDEMTDSSGLPVTMPSELISRVRAFRYHPAMPEMLMIETGSATKIINTLPHGSSYSLSPVSHGNATLTGSQYVISRATGASPSTDIYQSIPLLVIQPDSTVGFRDGFGFVNYPENVTVDFSSGFYLTGLISGHYAGNTSGKSFLYIGTGTGNISNNNGVGVYFAPDGCHLINNGSDEIIDSSMTFNSQSGQPCFYRVAVYQEANGAVHVSIRDCLTGNVTQESRSGNVMVFDTAKVWAGCDRDGNSTTVAIGELNLWIPDHDNDVSKVNFRG